MTSWAKDHVSRAQRAWRPLLSASKRESRFRTGVVSVPAALAGSRKEAWASEARGESKSTGADSAGFSTTEITGTSGMVFTTATGRTGTTGGGGGREGSFKGASGSKEEANVEESGATGTIGFCGRRSSSFGTSATFGSASFTTETGAAGFGAITLAETAGASILGATGRGTAGEPLAGDALSAGDTGAPGCGPEPMRSPGSRIPP